MSDDQLSPEQYAHGLDVLTAAARIVLLVDVAPMLDHLSRVETLAPVLDPTGSIRGSDNLDDQRTLLEAASAFRAELEKIRSRHPELERLARLGGPDSLAELQR